MQLPVHVCLSAHATHSGLCSSPKRMTATCVRSALRDGLAPLLAVIGAQPPSAAPAYENGAAPRPPSPQASELPNMAAIGALLVCLIVESIASRRCWRPCVLSLT